MSEKLFQVIFAFAGSIGFSMVFNVRRNLVLASSSGGFLSWGIFLIFEHIFANNFVACFIAAAFSALYSEIFARIKHAPASLFFIPSVVPLVPGGSLYYTMSYALKNNWGEFIRNGAVTIQYALGIACGISLTWTLWYMFQKLIEQKGRI